MPTHQPPSFPSLRSPVRTRSAAQEPSPGIERERDSLLARCVRDEQTGCLIWQGAKTGRGYGSVGVGDGKTALAHRVVWERRRGPIPPGKTVDHLCHTKLCLDDEHMELVTRKVNAARGAGSSPLYCRSGHPIFAHLGDWRFDRRGKRRCLLCARRYDRASWHRRGRFTRAARQLDAVLTASIRSTEAAQ